MGTLHDPLYLMGPYLLSVERAEPGEAQEASRRWSSYVQKLSLKKLFFKKNILKSIVQMQTKTDGQHHHS